MDDVTPVWLRSQAGNLVRACVRNGGNLLFAPIAMLGK